jgi:hypothetical protein
VRFTSLPLYPLGEAIRCGREGKQLAFMQFIYCPSKYYSLVRLPDFVFNDHRDRKSVVSQSVECTSGVFLRCF